MKTTKLDSIDKKNQKKHTHDLGLQLPKDYFSNSKEAITAKIASQKRGKLVLFSRKNIFWAAAASIILLFAVEFFKPNKFETTSPSTNFVSDSDNALRNESLTNNTLSASTEDVLLTSLFIDDSHVNEYIANYIKEEIITNMLNLITPNEDVLLSSLFIDDNHVNEYVDNFIRESIIANVLNAK
ncbi:hypothetical protein [uncultured Lutibacter sp.]|jgi:hypothetical protein|uniref:hypothetical protein n=1 Tax=uncultured Lutibacter sp. TaxID=437739 RepID=UPI00260A754C|nr:hypothetical protein [uncultured Lutibacter sp.]